MHNVSIDLEFQFLVDVCNILRKLLIVMNAFLKIMSMLLKGVMKVNLSLLRFLSEGLQFIELLD